MDLRLLFGGLCFIFLVTSCENKADRKSDLISFDLAGLVDSQVIFLTDNNYKVIKQSVLGTSSDSTHYVPDSAAWERELNIIRTADISKPGLRSYYITKSYDSLDYNIDHYILSDSGNSTTIYQKIYRDGGSGQVLKIKALQNVSNPIYDSKRYIEVTLKNIEENKQVIDSILVSGYQTLILSDTTFYRSISKIVE